jgi:hypothetical protein
MLPSACRKGKQANTHTNQKINGKTTTTTTTTTNGKVQSIITCKKRQQKQRSRFLQEYKSKTSYTLEDGHVFRNM